MKKKTFLTHFSQFYKGFILLPFQTIDKRSQMDAMLQCRAKLLLFSQYQCAVVDAGMYASQPQHRAVYKAAADAVDRS